MPEASDFHTEGVAMPKLREAKVVWTRGIDNRLVLEYCEWVIERSICTNGYHQVAGLDDTVD